MAEYLIYSDIIQNTTDLLFFSHFVQQEIKFSLEIWFQDKS